MNEKMLDFATDIPVDKKAMQRRALAVLVDNEFGVLARIIGLFSSRGYNIESLTVAEVDHGKQLSRLTLVAHANETMVGEIERALETMEAVHTVYDLTVLVERELALVKIHSGETQRAEAIRIADLFAARIVDTTPESFIFEVTGGSEKVDDFIALMEPLGIVEVSRTGVTAMNRGKRGI